MKTVKGYIPQANTKYKAPNGAVMVFDKDCSVHRVRTAEIINPTFSKAFIMEAGEKKQIIVMRDGKDEYVVGNTEQFDALTLHQSSGWGIIVTYQQAHGRRWINGVATK